MKSHWVYRAKADLMKCGFCDKNCSGLQCKLVKLQRPPQTSKFFAPVCLIVQESPLVATLRGMEGTKESSGACTNDQNLCFHHNDGSFSCAMHGDPKSANQILGYVEGCQCFCFQTKTPSFLFLKRGRFRIQWVKAIFIDEHGLFLSQACQPLR